MMKLSALPKSWVWMRLGEIAEFKNGINFNSAQKGSKGILTIDVLNMYSNNICVNLENLYRVDTQLKEDYLLKNGDILFVRSSVKREGVGWTTVFKETKEPITFCGFIIRARLLDKKISSEYLTYFLRTNSAREEIISASSQVTITNINQDSLGKICIPLPPLPEQRRIVTKIEELFTRLDAGVSALKKTQAQLKRYRQSVLKSACEGELVPTEAELARAEGRDYETADVLLAHILKERREKWKGKGAKYKEPAAPDTSGLRMLPEGWVWTQLKDIAEFKNGINFTSSQKGNKGILTVDVLNMYSNNVYVNLENLYRVDTKLKDDYLLKYGDILFVRSSVKREGVGWATLFKEIKEPVTFCGFIIRARLLQNRDFFPEYLIYFLRTNSAREDIIGSSSQVTITNINQDSLGKIKIPLPPLAEQRRIVAEVERRLSVADEVARTVEQSLAQAERLRQSILKKAFEGKLVAQDAGDEPASVLLERIRLQKQLKNQKRKSNSSMRWGKPQTP